MKTKSKKPYPWWRKRLKSKKKLSNKTSVNAIQKELVQLKSITKPKLILWTGTDKEFNKFLKDVNKEINKKRKK